MILVLVVLERLAHVLVPPRPHAVRRARRGEGHVVRVQLGEEVAARVWMSVKRAPPLSPSRIKPQSRLGVKAGVPGLGLGVVQGPFRIPDVAFGGLPRFSQSASVLIN